MASWSELLEAFNIETSRTPDPNWFDKKLEEHLDAISKRLGDATVIFYASAFLQKADDDSVSITREDINGFMNALAGTPTDNGLVLILHTPGGDPNAVESIVEYLHAKFDRIDVVIPYLAMNSSPAIEEKCGSNSNSKSLFRHPHPFRNNCPPTIHNPTYITDVTQFSRKSSILPQYLGSTGSNKPQDSEPLRNIRYIIELQRRGQASRRRQALQVGTVSPSPRYANISS